MIGLDTNVVVRYLVQDDLKQAALANEIIRKAVIAGETLWISLITLCEIVWVLERCYGAGKRELIDVISQLLQTQQIRMESDVVVRQALNDFEGCKGVDFSDCLIGRQNASNGCLYTYTFDKNAALRLHTLFKFVKPG